MPCDQIILNKVEIKAANLTLLTAAIESLVAKVELRLVLLRVFSERELAEQIIKQGFIRLPAGQEYLADKIKQEYSRQVVQAAARKFGWRVQQKAQQKLVVTRRV